MAFEDRLLVSDGDIHRLRFSHDVFLEANVAALDYVLFGHKLLRLEVHLLVIVVAHVASP